ncbi:MAG: protein kinase domain-containing protein [Phycisphaerales bacterium]
MNHDEFKAIEQLFHEFSALSEEERWNRLGELEAVDGVKAKTLRGLFGSLTQMPSFLDAAYIEKQLPTPMEIPVDGSFVVGGRYRILECVGVGGSSTVFRARASHPERDVAIKVLQFGLSSAHAQDQFASEAQSLAKLTHPHIAHVYEIGFIEDGLERVPWIALELIEGSVDIVEYARRESLGVDERVKMFVEICDAIEAAHLAGVLHLDLNASNILVDGHGYPKIIDFGLSGAINRHRTKLTFMGTRISMAPEQTLLGATPCDERTDVYALGLLFVELISGVRLQGFDGISDEGCRHLIAIGKAAELFDELASFPEAYRGFVERMIRVDPEDRFESVAVIQSALLEVGAIHGAVHRSGRGSRSALFVGAGCVMMLLVAWGGWTLSGMGAGEPKDDTGVGALALPVEVVEQITSENPRRNDYSTEHQKVIDGISLALESSEQMDPEQAADLHLRLADTYRVGGEYGQSEEEYLLAIEGYGSAGQVRWQNWARLNYVNLLLFLGRVDDAEDQLDLLDRTVESDPLFLLDLGVAEAQMYSARDQREQARDQLRYSITLIEQLPADMKDERVERMMTMSGLLRLSGDVEMADVLLNRANEYATTAFDPESSQRAIIEVQLAMSSFDPESPATYQPTISRIVDAISIVETSDDRFHEAWAYRQLGHVEMQIGDYQSAMDDYQHAQEVLNDLLGVDHHERLISFGYMYIAKIVLLDRQEDDEIAFGRTIDRLMDLLGDGHPVVKDLLDAYRLHVGD